MASVTITKHTTQSACAGQCGHIYRDNKNYNNKDIKLELTPNNVYMGNGADTRRKIHDTIVAIDERTPPKRRRADRKTVVELYIPAPREGIPDEDARRFLTAMWDALQHMDGCHVVGGAIHADEIHDYPTGAEWHTSRMHLHVLAVPDGERGLNMKSWLTKQKYRDMNALADAVCMRVLGYSYQDGTKQKSRGRVEELKAQSAADAVRQLPALQAKVDKAEQEYMINASMTAQLQQQAVKATKRRDDAKKAAAAAEQAAKDAQDALSAAKAIAQQSEQMALQAVQERDKVQKEAWDIVAHVDNEVGAARDELYNIKCDIERLQPLRDALDALDERDTLTTDQFVVDYLDGITYADGSTVWDGLADALDERDARRRAVQQWGDIDLE